MKESKTFQSLSKKFFIVSAVLIVVFLLAFFAIKKYSNKSENQNQPVAEIKESAPVVAEKPVAEKPALLAIDADANQLQSENFRMENVSFGGDASLPIDQDENKALEIYDVSNESFLNKKGDESKVVISWKSNKLTMAEVAYSKNDGESPKVVSESGFGFNHSVVITGLEMGKGYVYKIKSTDHWDNKSETEYFGFYSGARVDSIFEMIAREFQGIFGWALK